MSAGMANHAGITVRAPQLPTELSRTRFRCCGLYSKWPGSFLWVSVLCRVPPQPQPFNALRVHKNAELAKVTHLSVTIAQL